MTMHPLVSVSTGQDVYTAAGDKLGTVKDIAGTAFKVDASMQPDYWLPITAVASNDAAGVRMDFTKDHLGDFKVDGPEGRAE